MGMLTKLLNPKAATLRDPPDWFYESIGGNKTSAGIRVNETSAWNVSGVYACIRIISETIASLPLSVYRNLDRGKEQLSNHHIHRLLHDTPNEEMTAMVFRETLSNNLLSWGNAYAEIQRNGSNRPIALWPLLSSRVTPERNQNGQIQYKLVEDSGNIRYLNPMDVLHIPGMGFNGIVGQSVIRLAKETVGLTLASEEFGATFFGNGAHASGVLEHPEQIGSDAHERLRKNWNEMHQGSKNSNKVAILEEGMKWKPITIPPDDAQFLETRKFQMEEIARWYNVPPHKIGILDKATFSNITEQSIGFVVDTIRPWLVRWEQEINRKLFSQNERNLFVKHNASGLMRGDPKTRSEFYAKLFNLGAMSPNDIREMEDENPVPDGDTYYRPLNMQELGAVEPVEKEDNTREDKLTESIAQRLATKEQKAVEQAIKNRAGNKGRGFNTWARNFYRKYTSVVADGLAVDQEKARHYTNETCEALIGFVSTNDVDAINDWYTSRADELKNLHSLKLTQIHKTIVNVSNPEPLVNVTTPDISVNVPPLQIENVINNMMDATTVEIKNEIIVPDVTVNNEINIAEPIVNIENKVDTPIVNIENNVNVEVPEGERQVTFERDRDGNIISADISDG